MAHRPSDYASSWLSLFELFQSPHASLRISIPDTAILKDGQIAGWFYTHRDGVMSRVPTHDASAEAVFRRLTAKAAAVPASNSMRHIAVAHLPSGKSKPLGQDELQDIVDQISSNSENRTELPICIQEFILPAGNKRYVATYGSSGPEGPSCSVFARPYGLRTGASENEVVGQTSPPGADQSPVSAEEVLVERQLVAMGLLDPSTSMGLGTEAVPYVPQPVRFQIQSIFEEMAAYLESAHSLFIKGIVAEFIQTVDGIVILTSVLAVQWDTMFSVQLVGASKSVPSEGARSKPVTPAPASKLSLKMPPLVKADPSGVSSPKGGLFSPSSPSRRTHPTRTPGTPNGADGRVGRDGLPLSVVKQAYASVDSSGYTARNAMSSLRRGAGGNPTASPPASSSFTLWSPAELPVNESVLGSMVNELERVKEALQQQTDVTIRAEMAIERLHMRTSESQYRLRSEVARLEDELSVVDRSAHDSTSEYMRLQAEREQLHKELHDLSEEVAELQSALDSDHASLSKSIKNAQIKEEALEEIIQKLTKDNQRKGDQVNLLMRRVEEENEVINAVRSQLFDYRQMVTQLQLQLRRGKNKPAAASTSATILSPSGASPPKLSVAMNEITDQALQEGTEMRSNPQLTLALDDDAGSFEFELDGLSSPNMPSPRSISSPVTGRGPQKNTPARLATNALKDSPPLELRSDPGCEDVADGLGFTDPGVQQTLNEMRRLRRYGPDTVDATGVAASQMADFGTLGRISAPHTPPSANNQNSARRRERWRPNYESVVLQDLFISWGDMTDHMLQTQAKVLAILKEVENELLDIFKFYSTLGGVYILRQQQCMTKKQLVKMSMESGIHYEEQVADVFNMMSGRSTLGEEQYSESGQAHYGYISFDVFPETICRLASAKYEWRAPENNDEADDVVEVPEMLKKSLLGARERAASIQGRLANSPVRIDVLNLCSQAFKSKITDQVLLLIIKTFIFIDLLPNVRRTKTAGSIVSQQRKNGKRVPDNVWV